MASPLGVVVRQERLADKLAERNSPSIRTPKSFIERRRKLAITDP